MTGQEETGTGGDTSHLSPVRQPTLSPYHADRVNVHCTLCNTQYYEAPRLLALQRELLDREESEVLEYEGSDEGYFQNS